MFFNYSGHSTIELNYLEIGAYVYFRWDDECRCIASNRLSHSHSYETCVTEAGRGNYDSELYFSKTLPKSRDTADDIQFGQNTQNQPQHDSELEQGLHEGGYVAAAQQSASIPRTSLDFKKKTRKNNINWRWPQTLQQQFMWIGIKFPNVSSSIISFSYYEWYFQLPQSCVASRQSKYAYPVWFWSREASLLCVLCLLQWSDDPVKDFRQFVIQCQSSRLGVKLR